MTRVGVEVLTGVHWSVTLKEQKCTWWLGNATSRYRCVTGAWLHGLLECTLGHGKVITKLMINPFVNGLRLVSIKNQDKNKTKVQNAMYRC